MTGNGLPEPLSEAWWNAISRACGRIRPEGLPAVSSWLDQLEAACEDDANDVLRRIARQVPAPILAVVGGDR